MRRAAAFVLVWSWLGCAAHGDSEIEVADEPPPPPPLAIAPDAEPRANVDDARSETTPADDPSAEPDPEATARAKELYREGVMAFERGDYETALAHFRGAHELVPLPPLRYNIARTLEHLDEYGDALAEYEALLLEDGTDESIRDVVQQRIEVLRAKTMASPQ